MARTASPEAPTPIGSRGAGYRLLNRPRAAAELAVEKAADIEGWIRDKWAVKAAVAVTFGLWTTDASAETRSFVVSWLTQAVYSQDGDCPGGVEPNIDQMFTLGATRVIIGPRGAVDSGSVERLLARHGADRLAVGIDAKQGRVAPRGTQEILDLSALELATRVARQGIRTVIYNEVTRDGMLSGPDIAGATRIAGLGVDVIVSGGVGSLDDLRAARGAGLAGVCVGRALYDGRFTVAEALACLS